MQFHEYINLRNQMAKFGHDEEARRIAKSMKPDEFRHFALKQALEGVKETANAARRFKAGAITANEFKTAINHENLNRFKAFKAEHSWVKGDRPFYNVWPIAAKLAQDVKLELPFSAVRMPFESILLRFAHGFEPNNISTVMLFWERTPDCQPSVNVFCYFSGTMDRLTFRYDYDSEEIVENWLRKLVSDSQNPDWQAMEQTYKNADASAASLMIRLAVFIGILSSGTDLITPIVLAKDRAKYESTDDPDEKKWLEDRAARKMGRGFEVARTLELEREKSPHWRNPHLALFWTGPGRTKPVIKMRRGAVVQSVSMADVPTGYLGPETEADDKLPSEKTPRDVSPGRRFNILKRDGYQCQLCGKTQSDGATLHVDHKTPLAKGGSNNDDNLWTLCDACNLGKSDKDI